MMLSRVEAWRDILGLSLSLPTYEVFIAGRKCSVNVPRWNR